MQEINFHQLSEKELYSHFASSPEGLDSHTVESRKKTYGPNVLPRKNRKTLIQVILEQFFSPLIYVLLAAAVVSFILQEYSDGFFILLVLIINALIGTIQEWKAETKAGALQDLIRISIRVIRNGIERITDSEELVPGDIVYLEAGNKVPADVRITECANLKCEEALLTGESIAVEKNNAIINRNDLQITEKTNYLFAGTTITTGYAKGIVTETGANTEIGKIAESLSQLGTGKAPLVERMEVFARKISIVTLAGCSILGILGLFNGISLVDIFFFVVAVAVSAIPEGLPISMTVALSIGTARMAKKNVIVRKLTAVEGLGSCTYIATDKTGTLTVDQQTVRKIITSDLSEFSVTGTGYNGIGDIINKEKQIIKVPKAEIDSLIENLTLCNEGGLSKINDTEWQHQGDAVDVALLALSYKHGRSPQEIKNKIHTKKIIPFESEQRYSGIYYNNNSGKLILSVKGAVEKILSFCGSADHNIIQEKSESLAKEGYRVIAVASGEVPEICQEIPSTLQLLGLVALIDPLRPEAKEAISQCHQAGIRVGMITGDHPETALSIAKELNLASSKNDVVTGAELKRIMEDERNIFASIKDKKVFARVTPQQKQQIVETLKENGHFVAVTGDGVNDAPALKSANIGVAMGYGTDVAKDAASIIVADNNFASIAKAIEEGRHIYSNLRKIIYLLVSTGAAELLMIGLSLGFALPLPFLPVQLLWLNLVTNGIQDKTLAFEEGESHVMKEKPRDPKESIFNNLMIKQLIIASLFISVITFSLWYHLLNNLNWDESKARSTILLLMVLIQNFHVLNARSEKVSTFKIPFRKNPYLWYGIIGAQGTHILAMYIPYTQKLIHLQPLVLEDWIKLLFTASSIIVIMEAFKWWNNRNICRQNLLIWDKNETLGNQTGA
ncbi:MAG: cation-translocating P-type ATPase [Cytophagaceae bacterium]